MAKSKPGGKPPADSGQWLAFLNLGWVIAGYMLVFVGGGVWLDRHFGTSPVLLLVGVFFAFAGCGYSLYQAVKKVERDEKNPPPEG